jgi:hypothetical protein
MFEKKSQDLISRKRFINRQVKFTLYAVGILVFSLLLGIGGYMMTAHLNFIDALLNASMILTGMGPVNPMLSNAAKLFASLYSLYSGVAFLTVMGVFLAPVIHRFMHKLHLEDN